MPKGCYPVTYFADPAIGKPLSEIYAELDAYTIEYFEDGEGASVRQLTGDDTRGGGTGHG